MTDEQGKYSQPHNDFDEHEHGADASSAAYDAEMEAAWQAARRELFEEEWESTGVACGQHEPRRHMRDESSTPQAPRVIDLGRS